MRTLLNILREKVELANVMIKHSDYPMNEQMSVFMDDYYIFRNLKEGIIELMSDYGNMNCDRTQKLRDKLDLFMNDLVCVMAFINDYEDAKGVCKYPILEGRRAFNSIDVISEITPYDEIRNERLSELNKEKFIIKTENPRLVEFKKESIYFKDVLSKLRKTESYMFKEARWNTMVTTLDLIRMYEDVGELKSLIEFLESYGGVYTLRDNEPKCYIQFINTYSNAASAASENDYWHYRHLNTLSLHPMLRIDTNISLGLFTSEYSFYTAEEYTKVREKYMTLKELSSDDHISTLLRVWLYPKYIMGYENDGTHVRIYDSIITGCITNSYCKDQVIKTYKTRPAKANIIVSKEEEIKCLDECIDTMYKRQNSYIKAHTDLYSRGEYVYYISPKFINSK